MKKINLYIFGIGNVGSTLIKQILKSQEFFKKQHDLRLEIVGLANSTRMLINEDGIGGDWKSKFEEKSVARTPRGFYDVEDADAVKIAVDATASKELSGFYGELVQEGFHIATANKIANTFSQNRYDAFRDLLREEQKQFEYETNVGAGLPVIETLNSMVNSGEEITQVNGVFSGSLGYIFSEFSKQDVPFSVILNDALKKGYTEPDPREDLSGNDVARKLLILAREIGLKVELSDVIIENLVPEEQQQISKTDFLNQLEKLDANFEIRKNDLKSHQVLRHVGTLDVNTKKLSVQLVATDKDTALGQLDGSDGFFEIYSSSYVDQPLIIKGAGAGPEVTARGLLSDIIKISNKASVSSLVKC